MRYDNTHNNVTPSNQLTLAALLVRRECQSQVEITGPAVLRGFRDMGDGRYCCAYQIVRLPLPLLRRSPVEINVMLTEQPPGHQKQQQQEQDEAEAAAAVEVQQLAFPLHEEGGESAAAAVAAATRAALASIQNASRGRKKQPRKRHIQGSPFRPAISLEAASQLQQHPAGSPSMQQQV
jgi:hypothetical protein